jgi:hypothetical protein
MYGDPRAMDEVFTEQAWYCFRRGGPSGLANLGGDIRDSLDHLHEWRRGLKKSGIPVIALWGEQDPTGGAKLAHMFQRDFPHAETFLLPEVGHFPHIEAWEAVGAEIIEFCKRTPRGHGMRKRVRVEEAPPEEPVEEVRDAEPVEETPPEEPMEEPAEEPSVVLEPAPKEESPEPVHKDEKELSESDADESG